MSNFEAKKFKRKKILTCLPINFQNFTAVFINPEIRLKEFVVSQATSK